MKRIAIFLVLALTTCAQPLFAADPSAEEIEAVPSDAGHPTWALQITPYMWAAGLSGEISPFRRAPTISVEKSFSDVMDDLNFGGFINVWGRYERFVFSGDVMYVDTTDSHAFGPLPPLPIPLPPGTVINANADTKQFTATAMAGFRLLDRDKISFDALGGVRFWHISNELTVSALGRSVSHRESFGWADPIIGARAFLGLTDDLSLQAQADIGGFGAGSDLTWSVLATVNYVFTDNLSISAGYKVLDVDYDYDGYVYDTQLSGPVLGMTWRF